MWTEQSKIERGGKIVLRAMAMALVLVGSTACAKRLTIHGAILNQEKLAEIKPGEISRREVQEILGSPSSKAVFDKESWYYVSSRTETFAFFEPKIMDRRVVIIRFDKKGVVSKVETLNLKDGRKVQFVERVTPTKGKEFTLIEQLVGKIGSFSSNLIKDGF